MPKRGPANRAEPAGLAILAFATPEALAAAEAKWQDKVVTGRLLQVSCTGFLAAPHEVPAVEVEAQM